MLNRWYPIGKVGLKTVVATEGVTPLVEGTDYDVDLDAGLIRFYGSTVSVGDDISLTFGNDAVDFGSVHRGQLGPDPARGCHDPRDKPVFSYSSPDHDF
ncbi:MAG: hypothetical protein M5U12_06740 [Verrucomicrobia bacterium]|nr:hypothetical protein [Verrucomicrobiota bacterium]